jgi:hypothetical protein
VGDTQLRGYAKKTGRFFLQDFLCKNSEGKVFGFPERVTIFRILWFSLHTGSFVKQVSELGMFSTSPYFGSNGETRV